MSPFLLNCGRRKVVVPIQYFHLVHIKISYIERRTVIDLGEIWTTSLKIPRMHFL